MITNHKQKKTQAVKQETDRLRLGAQIRRLRKEKRYSQAELAGLIGISPSYLNLIENNRRRLSAEILIKISNLLEINPTDIAADPTGHLQGRLMEILGDPIFEHLDLTNNDVRELVEQAPNGGQALLHLYDNYTKIREDWQTLDSQIETQHRSANDQLNRQPSALISDFFQTHNNYFPDIEHECEITLARILAHTNDTHSSNEPSALSMTRYLEDILHISVKEADHTNSFQRQYDPIKRILTLSSRLNPLRKRFYLAYHIGLERGQSIFDMLLKEALIKSKATLPLGRITLANYFAAALIMPYKQFLSSARNARYDIERLQNQYDVTFEQICHRLATLNSPIPELQGIPLHFIKIDMSGAIIKRYSGSGLTIPRSGSTCARWGIHAAQYHPGNIIVQISTLSDGQKYLCIAQCIRKGLAEFSPPSYNTIAIGCSIEHAKDIIYADGFDIDHQKHTQSIGIQCRTCDWINCPQRSDIPFRHTLKIDANYRGLSPYAPADLFTS